MKNQLCLKRSKSRHLQKVILPVLLLSAVIFSVCTAQENQQDLRPLVRVRIFTLRGITAQQAKDYLQSAQVADTVLIIPGTTAISVAGSPEQLVHATSIIKLVDANEKFNIQFLDIAADKLLPAAEKIEAQLGRGYSIGSLMDGPTTGATTKAIVCLHKDKLLVITPEGQTDKITEVVRNSLVEKKSQADVNETSASLVEPLSQAEPNQQNLQQPPQIQLSVEPNATDSTLQQGSVQASSPQAVASANDIVFVKEPLVIEPNTTQVYVPAGITAEPNHPKTEDDMLGEFVQELTEVAKAEKEAKKIKTEQNQIPKPVVEPNINIVEPNVQTSASSVESQPQIIEAKLAAAQQEIVEQETADQNKPQDKLAAEPVEQQPEKGKQKRPADKIEKLPSTKPQPARLGDKQMREELPEETNSVQQSAEEAKISAVPDIDIPNGEEMLELNLPEKLEIIALIDLVGKYLNLNYLYDETKVTGGVTIKVQGRLRVRELYNLLESVLKFRGFVMSRKGRLVTITPIAEALDQDPTFTERIKAGDVITTNVFHLKYISTATAKKLLGEMKLGSNITEIPETGTLVITEYAFRMQRIEDLLSLVDVPGPPKEFKLRILNYTLAESLVPKVQALAEQLGTVNITVGTSAQPTPAAGGAPRTVRTRQPPGQPQQQPTDTTKKTGVYVDFDKRTNRVLMIGLTSEIAAVEQIIDTLDVPQQDVRVIQEYEIQYVDINKIVEALKELGIIVVAGGTPSVSASRRTVIEQPQTPAAPVPAQISQGQGQVQVSLDQPQVVMLESTNSLLVNATPEQHIQISRIISYIDREPVQAAIPYRIYRLENQEPEALAEVLNNLIEKTIKDKEGKIQQTIKYTEESIAIVPDKNTFSLIVYASKKNQEWIGNLIKSLDRRRPQVLIDVSLVEITRDDKFQVDIDVIANATDIVSNNIGVTRSILTGGSFPSTSPSKKLFEGGYFAGTGTEKTVKGFFNEGRIQALFDLIDKKGYGRILARPKILVNDNELGKIERIETEYVKQTQNAYPVAQTGTVTDQPITTQETYQPYKAQIALEITPQISEGELLRLEIKMTRQDFTETEGSGPKNTTENNINTIVTVPDGSTIILGGLTKLNQTKTGNKVPLLGDIPVAGTLFRSTSKIDKGNKLYIFVKANILRPEQTLGLNQLKNISQTNRAEFEKAESEFQKYEEFPGIKPKPIEPEKILEQDVNESGSLTMLNRK